MLFVTASVNSSFHKNSLILVNAIFLILACYVSAKTGQKTQHSNAFMKP